MFLMRVLGIDPGFGRVGIAILEKNGPAEILLYSECFSTEAGLGFPERLKAVGQKISEVVKKFKPQVAAIEQIFFNTNAKTALNVAEARGVIVYEILSRGIEVFEYTPLQVKMAITSFGHANKRQIIEMLKMLLVLPPKKYLDDEYDAIAVALTFLASSKMEKVRHLAK